MPIASPDNIPNPWEQQPASVSARDDAPSNARNLVKTKAKSAHIPDDWDDDDDEEEVNSQEIWEAANTRSPMPQLLISRSSTSATVVLQPPPTAIQTPMRILKRPTPTTTPSITSSASPSPLPKTLAEREAKYQEARERIFGASDPLEQDSPKVKTSPPKPAPNVIRNPAGPDTSTPGSNLGVSQGFGSKRGRRPPNP